MNEWKEFRLGDVIEFNPREKLSKGTKLKKIAMEHVMPFTRNIPTFETSEYSGGSKFRNGDTIMARITPCLENGKTAQVSHLTDEEVAFGSTEFIIMRSINNITDNKFIYYLAITPALRKVAIKSMIGSSGRQRVQQDVLKNYTVFLPPLPEQRAIAATLSCLDDKIELNNKINANLETQTQAIFKSWFVDFEPFRDGGFVDSELGRIPKGWRVGSLEDIARYVSERIPTKHCNVENYVSTDNMLVDKQGVVMANSLPTMPAVSRYSENDILISNIRPYFKKIWFANKVGGCSNDVLVIRAKHKNLDGFLYSALYSDAFFGYATATSKGTKMPRGDKSAIMKYLIALPSLFEEDDHIQQLSAIAMQFQRKISKLRQETRTLAALRDTLLPKLMSGEIEVPTAESIIQERSQLNVLP